MSRTSDFAAWWGVHRKTVDVPDDVARAIWNAALGRAAALARGLAVRIPDADPDYDRLRNQSNGAFLAAREIEKEIS